MEVGCDGVRVGLFVGLVGCCDGVMVGQNDGPSEEGSKDGSFVGSSDGSNEGLMVVGRIEKEGTADGSFVKVGAEEGYCVGLELGHVGRRVGFFVGAVG